MIAEDRPLGVRLDGEGRGSGTAGEAMQLKLKRSQRSGGMLGGKVVYMLDARAELTPAERALVAKHSLGKLTVYDSEGRKKRLEAAGDHIGGGGLWGSARGLASIAMAAVSLRVTIDSLVGGHHIECKDMDEMLGAEGALREGCQNLKSYLETAVTFDGREETVDF